MLAPAQSEDGIGVQGVAGKMDAANPFYRENAAACQKFLRPEKSIVSGYAAGVCTGSGIRIKDFRTAVGTAVRLSVISPVVDITVFVCAVLTHEKLLHYSTFPVIGERFYDRVSGSAVRAVDEWITVSTVRRIIELGFTFGAHCDIRGYESGSCTDTALAYCKAVKRPGVLRCIRRSIDVFRPDRFDLCHRRR